MIKLDRRLILNFDWTLLVLVLVLSGIGLVNIYSTGFSLTDFHRTPLYVKQIQWIILGVAGMAVAFFVDYRFLGRHAYTIYGISVILLVVVSCGGVYDAGLPAVDRHRRLYLSAVGTGEADDHPGAGQILRPPPARAGIADCGNCSSPS